MVNVAKIRKLLETTQMVASYLNEEEINDIFKIILVALNRMEKESQ